MQDGYVSGVKTGVSFRSRPPCGESRGNTGIVHLIPFVPVFALEHLFLQNQYTVP